MEEDDVNNGRFKKLGFKPQRENVYNKMLPYADKLDEESTKLFQDIKTNLVKAVLARELRPGATLWTSRLNKYMKIYGLKFSKEDHIALIKLYYELLTIPNLEPVRVSSFASTLSHLLKKKYLLSRDDLQLEWRPLYELCVRVLEKSKTDIGMYRFFSTLGEIIFNVIRLSRIYFPAKATQEIWDEFKPLLSPFNNGDIGHAIQYLEIFLPVCVSPDEAEISYKIWFEELMCLWKECHNSSAFENNIAWLMAKLSVNTIGYIDWEPYIDIMYVRFLRTFHLPVAFKQKHCNKQFKIQTSPIAVWIVSTLHGNKTSAFGRLEQFMQILESYYHPANLGRWTIKLREFLRKLAFCFVQRIFCERYRKNSWETPIPEANKLTDEDIDRFVNIMKPCLEQAMFSRHGMQDVSLALQYLASLRPNIIIPFTLEKLYASMDSLTEPHRLTSSITAVVAVGRYMLQGASKNYPEGPTHIVPLLLSLLPGIDPNDLRKCFVTFNFIVHFVNMMPLVNSSEACNYYNDLSEEEHVICEATSSFEDFVVQFFDRIGSWVDSSSLDFVRQEQNASQISKKNVLETIAESALANVILAVLYQSSPEIYTAALKKVFNFVTNKILEIQISGKMVAVVCQCFVRVNPKESLKLFVPYLCDIIEELLEENPNILTEEHCDAEFLYNFQILSELLDGRSELLFYLERLEKILDRTLHMTSPMGSQISARMLEVIMLSLSYVNNMEYRSCSESYDTPVDKFLPIRNWGRPYSLNEIQMSWYVPGEKEINCVQKLLNTYLIPEIEQLNKYSKGEISLSREHLRRSLKIVTSVLACQPVLPIWDEPALQLVESVLDPWAFNLIVSGDLTVEMPDGRNVRKVIADTMHEVQKKILEVDEGDTKSVQSVVYIYNVLLFNKSRGIDFESHWKNFHLAKKLLEDRLHQRKLHLRHVHMDRIMLQQNFRNESRSCSFTETHKQILLDLFDLSVSRYSENRIVAQMKLFSIVSYFAYSFNVLTPKIIEILQLNTEENHEKFKGCLYVLIGPKNSPIVTRHDWEFIRNVWPRIVNSMPSEKLSIVNLMNAISDAVHRYFPTIAINVAVPKRCLSVALALGNTLPDCLITGLKDYEGSSELDLVARCGRNKELYTEAVDLLLDACVNKNLHWRYNSMAIGFIRDLIHCDVKYNSQVIRFFLSSLINESIIIRKVAIKLTLFILLQNKPKFKKVEIDPFRVAKARADVEIHPGIRPDNRWLLYDSGSAPRSREEWDEPRFVHEEYLGFYCWPKKVEIYDSYDKQETAAKRMDCLTVEEREIYDFFSNESNVEQLIKYLSLEEKKGRDQFNAYRSMLFKNLFKLFEDKLLEKFVPHLQRLISDKQESNQRCAAELISGIIRGAKHWSYEQVERLWSILIPMLRTAISNISDETLNDWNLCIAMALESRDPNRHHWLLEFLMENPLQDATSFITCGKLHLLHSAINQQLWRNCELTYRLLDYFQDHLSHPYQNIREKISSCLCIIFSKDLITVGTNSNNGPKVKDFFDKVMVKLNNLYAFLLSKVEDNNENGNKNQVQNICETVSNISLYTEEEKENDIRLYKIVSKYITYSIVRVKFNYCVVDEYFELLPITCLLQNNDTDEEIGTMCTNLLAVIAQSLTVAEHIPSALKAIKKVALCKSWSARSLIAEFMSVFIFYNMATIVSKPEWVEEVQNIVLGLLEDSKPEVRINASQVLSGLLHCKFVESPVDLLNLFKQKAKTALEKKRLVKNGPVVSNNVSVRHAGVLGLCAFINCHPYDVPDYLPDIFGQLGPHLSDPQPIPATIRKTLGDFKRTHHDNWETHKLKFTEEELLVLSDLTVPPSYYA